MFKSKLYHYYYGIAQSASELSYAQRLKVGACLVTKTGAVYPGYNGTLSGFQNVCEKEDGSTDNSIVVHAEQNCLFKMLKEGVSAQGATLFVTASCCAECCKMMIASGVERVVYGEEYRDTSPLQTLRKAGVIVEKYDSTI